MIVNLNDFINALFEGIDIKKEEKDQIAFIIIVGVYKTALEILLSLQPKNKVLVDELNIFLTKSINGLAPNEKTIFQKSFEDQQVNTITQIFQVFHAFLPQDLQGKLLENLKKTIPRFSSP